MSRGAHLVTAPALGGVIIGHEVARALDVAFFFNERADGAMALRRWFGVKPGEGVLVVEDAGITGGRTREVMEVVTARGRVPS